MRRPYNPTEVLTPPKPQPQPPAQPSPNASTIATSPPPSVLTPSSTNSSSTAKIEITKSQSDTVQPINLEATKPNEVSSSKQWLNWGKSPIIKGIVIVGCLGLVILLISQFLERQKQQEIANKIEEIKALYEEKDYQKCIVETGSLTTIQLGVPEEKREELKGQCLLGAANEKAEQLLYQEAINIAVSVPKTSPNYAQAQTNIKNWSMNILQQANKFYEDTNDLNQALEILKGIPETSAIKKQALDQANE